MPLVLYFGVIYQNVLLVACISHMYYPIWVYLTVRLESRLILGQTIADDHVRLGLCR